MGKIKNWSKHHDNSWRHDSLPLELRVVKFGGVESPTGKTINQKYRVELADYSGVRATKVDNQPLMGSTSNKQEAMDRAREWMKDHPMPRMFADQPTDNFRVGSRAV